MAPELSLGLVVGELLDELLRFAGVRLAEPGRPAVEVADLVLAAGVVAEVRAVLVGDHGEDAAADRHPRLAGVAGFFPGGTFAVVGFGLAGFTLGVVSQKTGLWQVATFASRWAMVIAFAHNPALWPALARGMDQGRRQKDISDLARADHEDSRETLVRARFRAHWRNLVLRPGAFTLNDLDTFTAGRCRTARARGRARRAARSACR